MKNSPKMFYSYVQSNQKNFVSVEKVCNADGKISEDDKEVAQFLCDQFQQVFKDHGYSNLFNLIPDSSKELSAIELFPIDCVYKNKKDGYRQQNVRQRQKLISIIDYDVCMTFY